MDSAGSQWRRASNSGRGTLSLAFLVFEDICGGGSGQESLSSRIANIEFVVCDGLRSEVRCTCRRTNACDGGRRHREVVCERNGKAGSDNRPPEHAQGEEENQAEDTLGKQKEVQVDPGRKGQDKALPTDVDRSQARRQEQP